MRLPRPLAWLRHRRQARANGAYLRQVLADADCPRTVRVTITADTRQFYDALDQALAGVRAHRAGIAIRQALDAAEDFDADLRDLRAATGVDPADLADFREQLIDLTDRENTRAR